MPAVSARAATSADPLGPLKLLSDGTRLRILGLVEEEELSVGELSRALAMAQSRVSNHLRLLREGGLLQERHVGSHTYLRLGSKREEDLAMRLWLTLRDELASAPERAADRARLAAVLAERRGRDAAFFDALAGDWDVRAGQFATGQARERAAAHVLARPITVADVGAGTGYMAAALAGLVERLILVDPSPAMLREAERRFATGAGAPAVETRVGSLDDLPLGDAEVDAAVLGLVLHHLVAPERALDSLRGAIRPGGALVAVELFPHREAWMRDEIGDRHLGLEPSAVLDAFDRAGFVELSVETLADRYLPHRAEGRAPELPLYLVRGRVPARPSTSAR